MALVQERPSESSAGNPGCLSEQKSSVCVCASALKSEKDSKCVTLCLCVILQLAMNCVTQPPILTDCTVYSATFMLSASVALYYERLKFKMSSTCTSCSPPHTHYIATL